MEELLCFFFSLRSFRNRLFLYGRFLLAFGRLCYTIAVAAASRCPVFPLSRRSIGSAWLDCVVRQRAKSVHSRFHHRGVTSSMLSNVISYISTRSAAARVRPPLVAILL